VKMRNDVYDGQKIEVLVSDTPLDSSFILFGM
jgi:hypothetical protein